MQLHLQLAFFLLLVASSSDVEKRVHEVPLYQGLSYLIEGFLFEANTHLPQSGTQGGNIQNQLRSYEQLILAIGLIKDTLDLSKTKPDKTEIGSFLLAIATYDTKNTSNYV